MPSNVQRTNQLSNSIRVLQGLKEISEAPHLSPLKPICGVALTILTTIQAVRQIRDDHEGLIDRISDLADAIKRETDLAEDGYPINFDDEVLNIENVLRRALNHLEKEKKLTWLQRTLRHQELRDNISRCSEDLNACFQRFTFTSLIRIQSMLAETHLPVNVYKDSEVELGRSLGATTTADLYRARIITRQELFVVVKKYRDTSKELTSTFHRELASWRKLCHPNLLQVAGISTRATEHPFILFYEYSGCITQFIDSKLRQHGSAVDSFMMMLRVCQGIASGIDYLRLNCSTLNKNELEACFDPVNIAWTREGQAIVGHGIAADIIQIANPINTVEQMDDWIKRQFQALINFIVYGKLDLSNWNVLMARKNGRRTSHARLLEHFTSYIVPSFSHTIQYLTTMMNQLEPRHEEKLLDFKEIRLSALRLWPGAFVYRPSSPIQCSAGDIGYMQSDGTFVVLDQATELLQLKASKGPTLLIKSSGPGQFRDTVTDDEWIRHHFSQVNFASVRRRGGIEGLQCEGSEDWEYLLNHGRRIYHEHRESSPETSLSIQDLILSKHLMHVEVDLRVATFDRKGEGNDEPTDIDFVEHEGEPWGHWEIHDGRGGKETFDRIPQNIYFVQLEEEDFA